jgi:hypothetical protein
MIGNFQIVLGPVSWRVGVVVWLLTSTCLAVAQETDQFYRTLDAEGPVTLDIAVANGRVVVMADVVGRVSISARLQAGAGATANVLQSAIPIEQDGTHIRIGNGQVLPHGKVGDEPRILYRIDVPDQTQINSSIENGDLTIVGVDGPVNAKTGTGNIHISHIMTDVFVQTESGDLDVEAVEGRVKAVTHEGNISCSRIPAGVSAQTDDGDVTLLVVGPSDASVRQGAGRIEVGGARSTLVASTDGGEVHIKAVPHGDWRLASNSGNLRIEVPRSAGFDIVAATKSGKISIRRENLGNSPAPTREWNEKINGGGKIIQLYSGTGRIVIN